MHQDVEKILVTEEELNAIAHRLAKQITKDYEGKKLLLVGVLKGSIYFFTDLTRYIAFPCPKAELKCVAGLPAYDIA